MIGMDKRVVEVGGVRFLKNGKAFETCLVSVDAPPERRHAAIEQVIRQALSGVGECQADDYGVLDGYDDKGDHVAEYGIRDARTWRFLYRKLNWREGA